MIGKIHCKQAKEEKEPTKKVLISIYDTHSHFG